MSSAAGWEPRSPGGAVTLEQLIALNDEIVALVRAGVPLERGLVEVGGDLRGRLGRIAQALGERMGRGEGLDRALAAEGEDIPEVYRAVVEAGLRSGRLAVALEGLAGFARSFAALRQAIGLALLYPLIVVLMAYGLFVGFALRIGPRLLEAFRSLQIPAGWQEHLLGWMQEHVVYWVPVVPALLALIWVWWAWSGRAASLQGGWAGGPLGLLPWMRRMLVNTRAASFAELLALLVEHGVPLPEAITLAAKAAGDPRLRRAAGEVAEATRRGEPLPASVRRSIPPLLAWLMISGSQQGALTEALRHAAEIYRRRALRQAELVRVFLPTALMFALGASATLLYTATLFVPLADLLHNLALD